VTDQVCGVETVTCTVKVSTV